MQVATTISVPAGLMQNGRIRSSPIGPDPWTITYWNGVPAEGIDPASNIDWLDLVIDDMNGIGGYTVQHMNISLALPSGNWDPVKFRIADSCGGGDDCSIWCVRSDNSGALTVTIPPVTLTSET